MRPSSNIAMRAWVEKSNLLSILHPPRKLSNTVVAEGIHGAALNHYVIWVDAAGVVAEMTGFECISAAGGDGAELVGSGSLPMAGAQLQVDRNVMPSRKY
jgi:hypothetical protein